MSHPSDASSSRQSSKYRVDPDRPVPGWLVEEHRRHKAGAKPPSLDRHSHRPPRGDKRHPPRTEKRMNGDYIMVDLLDGAHLPTRTPSNVPMPLSSNSDSIISLPPVDNASSYFEKRAEARIARRDRRASSSIDTNFYQPLPLSVPDAPPVFPTSSVPLSHTDRRKSTDYSLEQIRSPKPVPSTNIAPPSSIPRLNRRQSGVSGVFPPGTTPSGPFPTGPSQLITKTTPDGRRNGSSDSLANHPLLHPLTSPHQSFNHGRDNSVRISRDWFDEDLRSNATSSSKGRRRNTTYTFHPREWGWRKPPEEDAVMPNAAWIYLALIGTITFFIAFIVNFVVDILSSRVITPVAKVAALYSSSDLVHVSVLASLRALSLVISFLLVLNLSPQFAAGSGIPEMKCVLSGVLFTEMLNFRTLLAKMFGLIFSLASGISIGRLGPFIHMSGITAALVAELPLFPTLRQNARFQLQALSAAMAAGVGATFGAPIGGTMLAIEVMSTYYYIHWLPMALYCSITGYYFVVTVINKGSAAFFVTDVSIDLKQASVRRVCTYAILGALCGIVGAALIQFTKEAFKFRRRHFKNNTPKRTIVMLALFAAAHTIISMNLGTLMRDGGKSSVLTLINDAGGTDVTGLQAFWTPFESQYSHWNSAVGLTIVLIVKFLITGLCLVLPVPAGTFMPIFELGAILGRAFGEWCCGITFVSWVDPRATAIIGAAGLATGTLHTTSIAVVMLELTREAIDVLPLAVGVIVSYGVSKCLSADLFSELIRIRKLPFMLGLRERYPAENRQFYKDVSEEVAGSFINKNFPFVTPSTTRAEIYEILTRNDSPWINCAFLNNVTEKKLWGTISRQTLWDVVMEDMKMTAEGVLGRPEYGTFNMSESSAMRGLETVEFLRNFDPAIGHPLIDMGPMQVSYYMPLWKIITFFQMLSLSTMYVMKDGMTVGTLGRMELIRHTAHVENRARRTRRQERQAQANRERTASMLADVLSQSNTGMRSRPSASDLIAVERGGMRTQPSASDLQAMERGGMRTRPSASDLHTVGRGGMQTRPSASDLHALGRGGMRTRPSASDLTSVERVSGRHSRQSSTDYRR